jgi:hypothetical protein
MIKNPYYRPRNLLVNNDAKPLNDKVSHDKLDIQDTGCSLLVARYSLWIKAIASLRHKAGGFIRRLFGRQVYYF